MSKRQRLLVIGAAGQVASLIMPALRGEYALRASISSKIRAR